MANRKDKFIRGKFCRSIVVASGELTSSSLSDGNFSFDLGSYPATTASVGQAHHRSSLTRIIIWSSHHLIDIVPEP